MSEDREGVLRDRLHRTLSELSGGCEPLDLVEDVPLLEAFLDDYCEARIADARSAGASWADIAARLGVSRQAAHKRFRGADSGRRRRAVVELRFERKSR